MAVQGREGFVSFDNIKRGCRAIWIWVRRESICFSHKKVLSSSLGVGFETADLEPQNEGNSRKGRSTVPALGCGGKEIWLSCSRWWNILTHDPESPYDFEQEPSKNIYWFSVQSELQCIVFELRCFVWALCNCIIPYNSKNNFVMSWVCLGQLPSIWWSLVSKRGIGEHFLFSLGPAFPQVMETRQEKSVGLVLLLLTFMNERKMLRRK